MIFLFPLLCNVSFLSSLMTGYRDDISLSSLLAMSLFSAYIMTGYRDDIHFPLPLFYAMSLSSVLMTGYGMIFISSSLSPALIQGSSSPFYLFLFSLFMTGYRDDFSPPLLIQDTGMILSTSSLFYAMSLFSAIMTGSGMILSTSSLFYAMSLFSVYIMTGYRDDIKHLFPLLCNDTGDDLSTPLPSSMQCLFFSAYIMTGFRDDIKLFTLPSSIFCLFLCFIMTGYRDDIKHLFPLLCYGFPLHSSPLLISVSFLCSHYDIYRDDAPSPSSPLLSMTLFLFFHFDRMSLLILCFSSSLFSPMMIFLTLFLLLCNLFFLLHYDRIQDDLLSLFLFYAMSLFSAYLFFQDTGMILHTLPLLCNVFFFLLTLLGYRDDISFLFPL
ncbi:unnamed protein product [Acanthosepion pharaonis]|uniref:Uncharacterized protein n=1 Tax=Acanthosepion pharaonis TaxID=158019 RepID=A0A812D868_ACAPH|nr:unnamed protein product [Sepia pharaonis]